MDNIDDFPSIFNIDVDGVCHGIRNYPGEIYDELVYATIKMLRPTLLEALEKGYAFNLLDIAERICEASKYLVSPEGIVAVLLSLLPYPSELDLDQQYTLAQIIDPVDQAIPGTLDRLQWEWQQAA